MKIKQKNINIGFLTIVLLLLTQTTKSEAAASTLFISDRESPAHLAFLEGQQRHYPAAYTLGDISWRRGSLTGFMALNGRSAHGSDAKITGQEQKTLQEDPQSETYPLAGICKQADVIVAVGWEAAQGSKQECTVPLLAVFVTRVQAIELLEDSPQAAASAIYLEIDPVLNLRLLAKMLPKATTIGVFVSPHSAAWLPHVRREAQQLQLRLEEIEATSDEEAVRELRTRIGNLDAVLLSPETSITRCSS